MSDREISCPIDNVRNRDSLEWGKGDRDVIGREGSGKKKGELLLDGGRGRRGT